MSKHQNIENALEDIARLAKDLVGEKKYYESLGHSPSDVYNLIIQSKLISIGEPLESRIYDHEKLAESANFYADSKSLIPVFMLLCLADESIPLNKEAPQENLLMLLITQSGSDRFFEFRSLYGLIAIDTMGFLRKEKESVPVINVAIDGSHVSNFILVR